MRTTATPSDHNQDPMLSAPVVLAPLLLSHGALVRPASWMDPDGAHILDAGGQTKAGCTNAKGHGCAFMWFENK